jgi:hypothetical protein
MRTTFASSSYPFPTHDPKFGGVVIQRFNIRSGRPSAPYRNNMDEILESVNHNLVPNLNNNNMLLEADLSAETSIPENYCLAEIPDFQSLLPQSHRFGIPVFALSDEQIERTGTVLEQMISKRDDFNQMFEDFAVKIEAIQQQC